METVLQLLKIDLGISHNLRDAFFIAQIGACKVEIESKGITLDLATVEDQVLLSDYATWRYETVQGRYRDLQIILHTAYEIRITKERAKKWPQKTSKITYPLFANL